MKNRINSFLQKSLALSLVLVVTLELFVCLKQETKVSAEISSTLPTPTFRLKRVNSGTGVKIIINKTKGADRYCIFMIKRKNAYSDYLSNSGNFETDVAYVEQNNKSKISYTIKGLPKGTYTFRIMAMDNNYINYPSYSLEKTITVKAAKAVKAEEKSYDFSNVSVGDTIRFGSYEQDDNMLNGKEEIEWIVLSKDSKRIFVMSKFALDNLSYNKEYTDVTWEDCTLRKWLNGNFYKTAFTKTEKNMINKVKLVNADNLQYEVEGGNDTKDKVFLLSLDDVLNPEFGFSSDYEEDDINRRCTPTAYAVVQGVSKSEREGVVTCRWCLRSPGCYSYFVENVRDYGYLEHDGVDSCFAIRPALYINLKS